MARKTNVRHYKRHDGTEVSAHSRSITESSSKMDVDKLNLNRNDHYKKTKREMSSQAKTAKAIRNDLKEKFPKTKFKVKSSSFAGGDAVDIDWIDGVTEDQVKKIVDKYQYGNFNGMNDLYENSNVQNFSQVKYVMTHREYSKQIVLRTAISMRENYSSLEGVPFPTLDNLDKSFSWDQGYDNWYQLTYKILYKLDLTDAVDVIIDPNSNGGSFYSGFKAVKKGEDKSVKENKDNSQLKDLNNFRGTSMYHNVMGVNVTDGVIYLMENGYSWFVTDALVILRMKDKVKSEEFVAIKLIVTDSKAVVRYEDGNDNLLFEQKYDFTDAKKNIIMFYTNSVLMLSGEY